MLKVRLIPALLLKEGRCIKTKKFENPRDTGDPIAASKVYDAQGADELLFLDITASHQRRDIFFDIIRKVADECFMPLTVGGGVRSIEDIRTLLKIGADKVAVCTAFVENPDFVNKASKTFGVSTIVGIITYGNIDGEKKVFTHGKETKTNLDVLSWAKELEDRGAGEIFLYSIDRDGVMSGYDTDLVDKVNKNISVPLIVCGGAGKLSDFVDVVKQTNVSAVSAGSIFHFTDQNLIKTRCHMKNEGLNVRSL
ncbi:MAG: imidazole glycerol phosphate synthase subunit HisF [Candidatus Omnitrophica bacterium]|nr:imidazole glycerol phosphate synthase subunit HisF [Candidatus Omnitrophota bacterium]